MTTIRASMLPAYPDCPRRAAAKQFRQEITDAGFELRTLEPTVGAAVGTAVHAAAATALRRKRDEPDFEVDDQVLQDAVGEAVAGFRAEVGTGAVWDETTPNLRKAEAQITRLVRVYLIEVVRTVEQPLLIEAPFEAKVAPRFMLTGHVDLFTRGGVLRDIKTGALPRPYQAQLGGYSLLLRSNGHQPEALQVDFIKRAPLSKSQDPPVSEVYDRHDSECAAAGTIAAIQRDIERFRETEDPWSFPANPMSLMCSPKYCPAHGTEWCRMGRKDGDHAKVAYD